MTALLKYYHSDDHCLLTKWKCVCIHSSYNYTYLSLQHLTAACKTSLDVTRHHRQICSQWRHSLLTRVDKVQGPPRSKGTPSATCKNLFQLQSRFEGLHLVSGLFSFLYSKSLLQLSDADLNSAAQKFQETYSADIDSDFVAEVRSFRRKF